jgi:hypothetical protein
MNPESYAMETAIIDEQPNKETYDHLFEEEYLIMSNWTEEEKSYFYENFVFSFEELEEEIGLKLPH